MENGTSQLTPASQFALSSGMDTSPHALYPSKRSQRFSDAIPHSRLTQSDTSLMRPSGNLIDALKGHGSLALGYYDFLQSAQPAKSWDDIKQLTEPLPKRRDYSIDWNIVARFASSCPPLVGVLSSLETYNEIAPLLGFNYAWTRLPQHLHLLDAIEIIYDKKGNKPSIALEPGCFTGGLLHYLAKHWEKTCCIGFDLSPVALDVFRHYSDNLNQENSPLLFQADFCQVSPNFIFSHTSKQISGGIVIMCNMIDSLASSLRSYPYIDELIAKSRLISYWVNQGTTVLLCERHMEPQTLADCIVDSGQWDDASCTCEVMAAFTVPTTSSITPDNPVGTWTEDHCCIIKFSKVQTHN